MNSIVAAETNSLKNSEIVETTKFQTGVSMNGTVGQPFQNHRHGQDRFATQHVRFKKLIVVDVKFPFKRDLVSQGKIQW